MEYIFIGIAVLALGEFCAICMITLNEVARHVALNSLARYLKGTKA